MLNDLFRVSSTSKTLMIIILVLTALLLIFLVTRELVCWYWKINERIKLQEAENADIKDIKNMLSYLVVKPKKETNEEEAKEKPAE